MKSSLFNKLFFTVFILLLISCNNHITKKDNLQENQKADTDTVKVIKQVRIDHSAPNQEYIDSIKAIKTKKKK